MTKLWKYTLATPADAEAALSDPNCKVFSAVWKEGLVKDATCLVVAAPADGPQPGGTPLASVMLASDKDALPPPPPPPPATSVNDFGAATTAFFLAGSPRTID